MDKALEGQERRATGPQPAHKPRTPCLAMTCRLCWAQLMLASGLSTEAWTMVLTVSRGCSTVQVISDAAAPAAAVDHQACEGSVCRRWPYVPRYSPAKGMSLHREAVKPW